MVGSPDWARTSDLPVTLILMFPLRVDYIFTMMPKGWNGNLGASVSSLYGVPIDWGSHGIGLVNVFDFSFHRYPDEFQSGFCREAAMS